MVTWVTNQATNAYNNAQKLYNAKPVVNYKRLSCVTMTSTRCMKVTSFLHFDVVIDHTIQGGKWLLYKTSFVEVMMEYLLNTNGKKPQLKAQHTQVLFSHPER